MTVEAGLTLAEAQAAADSVDRLFPLSLPSEGSCQIGGNLGTNAGGVERAGLRQRAPAGARASRWCWPTGASGTASRA